MGNIKKKCFSFTRFELCFIFYVILLFSNSDKFLRNQLTVIMLQYFPRRQISHVEQSTSKISRLPQRKISECILERKTRHGSVISIETSEVPLEGADLRKDQLIKALKREVKKIMDESGIKKRICLYSNIVSSICGRVFFPFFINPNNYAFSCRWKLFTWWFTT